MTDTLVESWAHLLLAVAALMSSAVALVSTLRNSKQIEVVKATTKETGKKVEEATLAVTAKVEEVANAAAAKVSEEADRIKADLHHREAATDSQLLKLTKVTEGTHSLVNSSYVHQLGLTYMAYQKLADKTRDPVDIAAATQAKRLLQEYKEKEESVHLGVK